MVGGNKLELSANKDRHKTEGQAAMDDPPCPKVETVPDEHSTKPTGDKNNKATQLRVGACPGAPLRKKRSLDDKICRICGDKALAHNFDVITCESCKAFFRRNALKREEVSKLGVGGRGGGRRLPGRSFFFLFFSSKV